MLSLIIPTVTHNLLSTSLLHKRHLYFAFNIYGYIVINPLYYSSLRGDMLILITYGNASSGIIDDFFVVIPEDVLWYIINLENHT